jgi:hypothetical protein
MITRSSIPTLVIPDKTVNQSKWLLKEGQNRLKTAALQSKVLEKPPTSNKTSLHTVPSAGRLETTSSELQMVRQAILASKEQPPNVLGDKSFRFKTAIISQKFSPKPPKPLNVFISDIRHHNSQANQITPASKDRNREISTSKRNQRQNRPPS